MRMNLQSPYQQKKTALIGFALPKTVNYPQPQLTVSRFACPTHDDEVWKSKTWSPKLGR